MHPVVQPCRYQQQQQHAGLYPDHGTCATFLCALLQTHQQVSAPGFAIYSSLPHFVSLHGRFDNPTSPLNSHTLNPGV